MRKDVELSAFTMHLNKINAVEPVGAEDIRERYRFDVNSSNKTTTVRWIERMSITLVLRNPQSLNTSLSTCLLYTSDAADEEDSVDLGGRRIIKKKKKI